MIANDDAVGLLLQRSAIVRWPSALLARAAVASRKSAIVNLVRRACTEVMPRSATGRLRFAAMTVAWTAVAHLGLRSALPRYAASGLPWWWNLAAALFALSIAAAAPALADAWPRSIMARVSRRAADD